MTDKPPASPLLTSALVFALSSLIIATGIGFGTGRWVGLPYALIIAALAVIAVATIEAVRKARRRGRGDA